MSDLERFSISTWDRFFEFLCLSDGKLTDSQVDAELKAAGIDTTAALRTIRKELRSVDRKRKVATAFQRKQKGS